MHDDKTKEGGAQALFEAAELTVPMPGERAASVRAGAVRLRVPDRSQVELRAQHLESLLAEGHRARLVWGYVERQDLGALHAKIRAREGTVGRDAIDPRVLFALWLYATLEGVGSARELARLSQEHDACRWICGGIQLSYRTLAKWRVEHGEVLDELLTENLAALAETGVVKLARVAQDGMRVRASAGAASFRREERLVEFLEQARARVAELKGQTDSDPGAAQRRAQAARLRAAQERERRIQRALDRLPEMAAAKRRAGKKPTEARASTTDAEASTMKMADGGFRPAYNVQLASDCDAQVIVGVAVVTAGQIEPSPGSPRRHHRAPRGPGGHHRRAARSIELRSGIELPYRYLVIATGTRVRRLPHLPDGLSNVAVLCTAANAVRLRERFGDVLRPTVVGGEFIGLDVAATARAVGKDVTVLESAPRLLMRSVSPELAEHVLRIHCESGIDMRLGVAVGGFEVSGDWRHSLPVNGVRQEIDTLLLGIGVVPEHALATQTGLLCDNGIVVDEHMQTSDPFILAIGDCTSFPEPTSGRRLRLESARNANDHARRRQKR